ncbi:MAG: sigma-70 family RNA polymerase sigma factor [Calditrichaeota bacterium]|nr:MAG: sigma-70 family RNA polymerase sigma factor [Calditrichota bacterium]
MLNRYKQLKNVELINLCKQDPIDQRAWMEFYDRFHNVIAHYVYKWQIFYKIRTFRTHELNDREDTIQRIFLKLSTGKRKAIKSFRNETENSIFAYLRKMIKYEVINSAKHNSAVKRKGNTISIHESASSRMDENNLQVLDYIESTIDNLEHEQEYKNRLEECRTIIGNKKKNKFWKRDLIIFELHFIYGLKAHEIAEIAPLETQISNKRIANRITEIKKILNKI